jgi:hypothetical protein
LPSYSHREPEDFGAVSASKQPRQRPLAPFERLASQIISVQLDQVERIREAMAIKRERLRALRAKRAAKQRPSK